jgi:hypothetical protein
MGAQAKAIVRWVTLIPVFLTVAGLAMIGKQWLGDPNADFAVVHRLAPVHVPALTAYPGAETAWGVLLLVLTGVVSMAYFYWWAPSRKLQVAFWTLFFFCLLFVLTIKCAVFYAPPLYTVLDSVPSLCIAGSAALVFALLARRAQVEERRAALRHWWVAAILLAVAFFWQHPGMRSLTDTILGD